MPSGEAVSEDVTICNGGPAPNGAGVRSAAGTKE